MELIDMPGVNFSKIKKGTVFIKQGDTIPYLYYLKKGYFYRIHTTAKGGEVIYSIKSASEDISESIIGVFSLYGNHSSQTHIGRISQMDFVAMTDCEGYIIPKEIFYSYVQTDPDLLSRLLDVILDEYVRLIQNYQSHQEHSVANRLCQLLLEYSVPNKDNTIRSVQVKNTDLSGLLGIHAVTVSRIIRSLKTRNAVERAGKELYIIDVPQVERYAKGEPLIYQ